MERKLKDVRDRVLTENTAQSVRKYLDHFEDNRSRFESRWVWELLQNARDAAGPAGAEIEFSLIDHTLIFRHTGTPFTPDGITHLIYHGSTKVDDPNAVGHFGSGFLSTHLLSRVIEVVGPLEGDRRFAFQLDRNGTTVDELRNAMDRSWAAFEDSVASNADGTVVFTEFRYPLTDSGAKCCSVGLEELERTAPAILAFCPQLLRIKINTLSQMEFARVTSDEPRIIAIECRAGETIQIQRLAVIVDPDVQTAIPLMDAEQGTIVALSTIMPRIFIAFPLLESAGLGIPGIVNSLAFKPHEDRNGIVLDGDSEGAIRNRAILEAASRQLLILLEMGADEKWLHTHTLLSFHGTALPAWANPKWFNEIISPIVKHARTLPVLLTVGGERVLPSEAWIPVTPLGESDLDLWELLAKLSESRAKLPPLNESPVWGRNLANWARLLGKMPIELPEAWTLDLLAEKVADAKNLKGLKALLVEGETETDWLSRFLALVTARKAERLFDVYAILPSQAGEFRNRAGLKKDEDISGELKDIAHGFEYEVRDSLLHANVVLPGDKALLGAASEADVLGVTIERFRHLCQNHKLRHSFLTPAVHLFWWIVQHSTYHERLNGFPVATDERLDEFVSMVELNPGENDRALLVPSALWPESARPYELLFAAKHKIAKSYAELQPNVDGWSVVVKAGLLHGSPLYQRKTHLETFIPAMPLQERPGEERHRTAVPVDVSTLAFLSDGDGCLIDKARKSKKSALDLLRFVLAYAFETDTRALERLKVTCVCGEQHEIYRGEWLVPIRERAWIFRGDKQGSERPSAEALSRLVHGDSQLTQMLLSSDVAPFVSALGVSPSDLALRTVAADESSRVSLIQAMGAISEAVGGDSARLCRLATELRQHPDIIASIEQQQAVRQRVHQNQQLGTLVEHLLRDALREEGLTVRRTGVGSDFEIDTDVIESEKEVWFELNSANSSTLLEVKATQVGKAKMTPTQAEMASKNAHRFALCVINVDSDAMSSSLVRARSKFLFDIGEELRPLWTQFAKIRSATTGARKIGGDIALEIIEGQSRFVIDQSYWQTGLTFDEAVTRFARMGRNSD